MTFQPGALRCTTYRSDGLVTSRCGSFETIGLPVAVFDPAIAQLLLPGSLIVSSASTSGDGPNHALYGAMISGFGSAPRPPPPPPRPPIAASTSSPIVLTSS